MDIRLSVDTSGLMARFQSLAAAAADPTVALLRCGGLVRSHAKKVFEAQGPGWAALDPETAKRKITGAEIAFLKTNRHGGSTVTQVLRLARQIQKGRLSIANAKTDKAHDRAVSKNEERAKKAEEIAGTFASKRLSSFAAMVRFAEREKARKARHGQALSDAKVAFNAGKITDAERKKAASAGKRRYLAQGNADRMLGNLDQSLGMHLEGRTVKVYSHAKIGGIHNVGGTAGHGAKIPARPFMYVPDGATAIFAEIFKEVLTGAFVK